MMILIGQYDSSFVRRVGIALTLYRLPFEHRPWSVFSDAEAIARFNPLLRVPVLVLDGGDALTESHLILQHLDRLAPAGEAMVPEHEPERHRALSVAALATGIADKAVSLFYEIRLHEAVSEVWASRCRRQILAGLAVLESDRAGRPGEHWFDGPVGHADIAVAACLRHADEAHPGLIPWAALPHLKRHCAVMEALPVFQAISQPFVAPT